MTLPTPRRRWFQFSMASLLWLMLTVALAIVALREHRQRAILDAKAEAREAHIKRVENELDAAKTEVEKLQPQEQMRIDGAVLRLCVGPVQSQSQP